MEKEERKLKRKNRSSEKDRGGEREGGLRGRNRCKERGR
jgi:hypothetical protein